MAKQIRRVFWYAISAATTYAVTSILQNVFPAMANAFWFVMLLLALVFFLSAIWNQWQTIRQAKRERDAEFGLPWATPPLSIGAVDDQIKWRQILVGLLAWSTIGALTGLLIVCVFIAPGPPRPNAATIALVVDCGFAGILIFLMRIGIRRLTGR